MAQPVLQKWWEGITHFKPREFSYPQYMEEHFVRRLDQFRNQIGVPGIITSSNDPEDEHSDNSLHYRNIAVDIVFPNASSVLDTIIMAMRYFNGVGFYPYWSIDRDGRRVQCGGFHVEHDPGRSRTLLWMGVPGEYGQAYIGLTEANLRVHKAI